MLILSTVKTSLQEGVGCGGAGNVKQEPARATLRRDGFPVGCLVAVRMVHFGSHWFPCTIVSGRFFDTSSMTSGTVRTELNCTIPWPSAKKREDAVTYVDQKAMLATSSALLDPCACRSPERNARAILTRALLAPLTSWMGRILKNGPVRACFCGQLLAMFPCSPPSKSKIFSWSTEG